MLKVALSTEENGRRGATAEDHCGFGFAGLTELAGGSERWAVAGHYEELVWRLSSSALMVLLI
jgi:hypothetical protein